VFTETVPPGLQQLGHHSRDCISGVLKTSQIGTKIPTQKSTKTSQVAVSS